MISSLLNIFTISLTYVELLIYLPLLICLYRNTDILESNFIATLTNIQRSTSNYVVVASILWAQPLRNGQIRDRIQQYAPTRARVLLRSHSLPNAFHSPLFIDPPFLSLNGGSGA